MPPSPPKKRTQPLRIAIVGTGGMANAHAERYAAIRGCRVVAACDIDPVRAADFAKRHAIPASFDSLDRMLAECAIDAVSVVTPDAAHAPVSIRCARAGKHVLCEKPLALDHRQARRMLAAVRKAGVVHMVNFSYRDWPCIQGAAKAVADGAIGEIRHVEASYLQAWLPSRIWGDWRKTPAWLWRLSTAHGSKGVLGDIGVHILDYTTFACGPLRSLFCSMRAFPKAPGNRIGPYTLDANDSAVLNVEFRNGALGTIHTSRWVAGHPNRLALTIAGTRGTISMDSETSTDSYRVCRGSDLDSGTWRTVACRRTPNIHERFIAAIQGKCTPDPDFARGAAIQRLLDASFESASVNRPVRV
jgi:predicted dehydrogenase